MRFVVKKVLNQHSKKLVILLTGRYQSAGHFLGVYLEYARLGCNYIAIQPEKGEWYPLPNGPADQNASINGIKEVLPVLHKLVKNNIAELGIEKNQTSLVGYSAGGVMALELNAHNKKPFHSLVIHSGAILRTNDFPKCKNNTPILLLHKREDDCFKWDERFIPMKNCLKRKGYNFNEMTFSGNHELYAEDIIDAASFINNDT